MVNVPPESSGRVSFPSRAFSERSRISRASSLRLLRSASWITGTIRPSGVAVAIPMW